MPEVKISEDVLGLCIAALNYDRQTIIDDIARLDEEGQCWLSRKFVSWLVNAKIESIESEADFYGANRARWFLLHDIALLWTNIRMA